VASVRPCNAAVTAISISAWAGGRLAV
jgi:hypothetical protein